METLVRREAQFEQLLQSDDIAKHVLKTACLHGIPDNADLRAEAWRMLLGVVELVSNDGHANNHAARNASKARKRKEYYDLAAELLGESSSAANGIKTPQDSWLDDIDKDVRRTQTSYAFFSQIASRQHSLPRSLFRRLNQIHPHRQEEIEERYNLSPSRKGKEKASPQDDDTEGRHFESLIRMLYIFALLNPVHYVQGMSELIAPLYYVFSQSSEQEDAEADTFWAFSFLMGEIGDFYVQDSDGSFGQSSGPEAVTLGAAGLGAALRQFAKELHWIDSELAYNLHTQKEIQPTFYALRWITCLLAMDFRIPDLVRIWDSIFAMFADSTRQAAKAVSAADSEARAFLLDLCVAMVLVKRGELLSSSFSACLNTLQNYACEDVHTVLTLAFSIRERRITSSLTGIEISSFSSVPNSPLPDGGEFSGTPSPSVSLQNARQALSAAASNVSSTPTARAIRQRLFKQRDGDYPDDASDVSSVTASAVMDSSFTSPSRSAATSPATTIPSSASSLLNKYAKSFASSDAAAQLNKMTTNSYIAALHWKESAPSTFSKWKTDVSSKVSEAAGTAKTVVRPPSPTNDPPFTPPTGYSGTGRWLSPEIGSSPGSNIGDRRGSGPKPLLLSSAARRASATLQSDMQPASPHGSASASRRTSYSGPGSNSLGLGLPRSGEHGIHRSRTPSPTAPFRSGPHSRAASTSQLGSYKIGNGRNGHTEHARAGSFAGSSPSAYKLQHSLSDLKEKSLPTLEDEVSLARLAVSDTSPIKESQLPRPPPRPRRSIDFALLREKGASNDLEVLNDDLSFGDSMSDDFRPTTASSMSHFFKDTTLSQGANTIETPPQSPKQKYTFPAASTSDDTPLSPTRSGAGLARSVNRHPRTSSLATIDTERDGSVSPTHIRSPTSSIDLTNGDSSVPQRPSRRKLASSRKLPTRDSIDSASVASADVDA